MTKPITLINGQLSDTLSTCDRGLLFGDGVFETMLLVDKHLPFWAQHHERLLKGLVYLGIPLESQLLRQTIDSLIEQAGEGFYIIKLLVSRGQGSRGYQGDLEANTTLIGQLFPYCPSDKEYAGVNVHFCEQILQPVNWAGLKTLNQLNYVLAARERLNRDFEEGLLLSADNQIVEATARNLFIVRNEELLTPSIERCGVAGVMRQYIMDKLAAQLGLQAAEAVINKQDLFAADEVFLCNSVSGIWPVLACEEQRWSVGPITRSLQSMCHPLLSVSAGA